MNRFLIQEVWHHANISMNKKSSRRTEQLSDDCLNIFSLNIRCLPKHGGELLQFDLNKIIWIKDST